MTKRTKEAFMKWIEYVSNGGEYSGCQFELVRLECELKEAIEQEPETENAQHPTSKV